MNNKSFSIKEPWLIYDGDCSFCRLWVERWRKKTSDKVRYEPFQKVAGQFSQIPLQDFQKSVQLILPDGRVFNGAAAVFRTLAYAPDSKGRLLWLYEHVVGFRQLSEWFYNLVAAHRDSFYRATQFLFGEKDNDNKVC